MIDEKLRIAFSLQRNVENEMASSDKNMFKNQ